MALLTYLLSLLEAEGSDLLFIWILTVWVVTQLHRTFDGC